MARRPAGAAAAASPTRRRSSRPGDKHCKANQKLRLQTQNALKLQNRTPTERRRYSTSARPGAWLKHDKVPTFLVGQFQDEQTGGHFAESLQYLAHNPNVWISMQNGVHADSLGPDDDHALGRVPRTLRRQRGPRRSRSR